MPYRCAAMIGEGDGRGRQDALDGVRALALVLVLLFHAGFRWIPAGYVGVSVFFTLSGYLITNLLLTEYEATQSIRLGSFYARRWKRLLPAGLLCLMAIALLRHGGAFRDVADLRHDLAAATLQVFNWTELAADSTYAGLFDRSTDVSPVMHFWSLAIEEQFYLLWPVVLLGLLAVTRRRSVALIWLLAPLTLVFAVIGPLIGWRFGPDAAYWSTPSRFGEILVGACLACLLRMPAVRSHMLNHRRRGSIAAFTCAALIVVAAVVLPSNSGPAFTGWMSVFALVSAGLIVGLQSAGPMRRALSLRPLVLLGLISYGAYLFHWPVFVLFEERGWSVSSTAGFGAAVAVTLALAAASYQLIEQPIRHGAWSVRRVSSAAALATAGALIVVGVTPTTRGFLEPDEELLEAASIVPSAVVVPLQRRSASVTRSTTPSVPAPISDAPISEAPMFSPDGVVELPAAPNRPVRILVVGDSTAFYVGEGLAQWAVDHPEYGQVDLLWSQGFGLLTTGVISAWDATEFVDRSVEVLAADLPAMIERTQPDVVVLMTTIDDVLNRTWNDAEGELTIGDPAFRDRLATAYREATASLIARGAPAVAWIIPPAPSGPSDADELEQPATFAVHHDVIRQVVDEFAGAATAIELDRWMAETGHSDDETWRPDGTHLTSESASRIAQLMLGPTLVGIATDTPSTPG